MTTEPKPKPARRALLRVRRFVAQRCLSLCWATYTLGIIWLFLHPAVTVTTGELKCRGTYMSENALLIDLMEARASHQEANSAKNFHQNMLKLPDLPSSGCGNNCSNVVDWIGTQLRGLDRVEAYTQDFQTDVHSPLRQNIYGILRASPLADGKEAIVLLVHYRNAGKASGEYSGLSLGLALLKYLARAKWLAKDVILLAADDGVSDGSDGYAPGIEAWLQAYHLDPVASTLQGVLPMRAGVIRAAVNLETLYHSQNAEAVGIYTAGMNGQLPNLDLVNTAVRSFRQHHIPQILDRADAATDAAGHGDIVSTSISFAKDVSDKYSPPEYKDRARDYLSNLQGMLHFMTTLATGPSGPHANFISYNIDSITLSLTKTQASTNRPLPARDVLRSIEMVVRALSNLEEKLHQSFFLYVLPSTSTFVSVGEYYYTVALAISPAIAHLLTLPNQMTGMRIAFALAVFLAVEALSVVLLATLSYSFATLTEGLESSHIALPIARWWAIAAVISVIQVLVAVSLVRLLRSIPILSGCAEICDWRKKVATYEADEQMKQAQADPKEAAIATNPAEDIAKADSGWRALKFLAMALLVYGHCILGILNYPMALFCAIPMAHFSRIVPLSTGSSLQNAVNGLWLLVSSPIVLFTLLSWSRFDVATGLSFAVDTFVHRINLLCLPYICCIYLPVHTLSLAIWAFPASSEATRSEKQKLE